MRILLLKKGRFNGNKHYTLHGDCTLISFAIMESVLLANKCNKCFFFHCLESVWLFCIPYGCAQRDKRLPCEHKLLIYGGGEKRADWGVIIISTDNEGAVRCRSQGCCNIKTSRNMQMLLHQQLMSSFPVYMSCVCPPVQCHSRKRPARGILANAYATAAVWVFIQQAWWQHVLELEK